MGVNTMNFTTLHKHAKTLYQASERLLLAIEREMVADQAAQIAPVDEPTETLLEEPKRVETPVVKAKK
jgi:hypothetical protein